jgi:outer membrane protein assembly factor BamE (lipoprotein component of BamABCDE complex)
MSNGNGLLVHVRSALVCAGAALLVACGTVQIGHDFDIGAFDSRVQRGETTQAQVRAWLGAPSNTGVAVDARGERNEEWTYYFGRGRLPGMADAKFKMLQVRFDTRGRVMSYSWSGETPKTAGK